MQRLYKILDYCQSRGVTVMFGEWWKPGWAGTFADSRYITSIAECLNYLRNIKGYTCIKYYNFMNEPNGDWMYGSGAPNMETRWNNWYNGVRALYDEFNRRGYLGWIQICGPDTAYADDWVDRTVYNLGTQVGQLEFHIYKDYDSQVYNGEIESTIAAKRSLMNSMGMADRHLWLGELGMKQGKDPYYDSQPRVANFDYGVLVSDGIVQTIRAGGSGVIVWMLDDAMHLADFSTGVLKKWGMWNSMGGRTVMQTSYPSSDKNLRPWYYPVSLFSKLFGKGWQTVEVSGTGISGVRVAAAKRQNGSNWDISIAIVNNNDASHYVLVQAPGVTNTATFKQYNYFANDRPVDGNGFPAVKMDRVNNLSSGIGVDLPGRGVVFLTTTQGGTPISVSGSGGGSGNLALNKTAYSSSNENSSLGPANAVDGNTSTRWSSAWQDNQSFWVDLGSNQTVGRVRLNWEAAYARSYQIQVSTDGSTWTTVAENWNGDGGIDELTFSQRTARYVKIYCIQRATQYGFSLWEFEVYSN